MKKPYLDQQEREVLKLNRANLIWTPDFIVRYELKVAWRGIKRDLFRIIKNWR